MNTRSRAVLIVIATLAIGVVVGTLLVGPLVARHHFRHLDTLRTREGFASRMEKIIEPNASQVGPVRDVLAKYAEQFEEMNTKYHESMKALTDSMRQDLSPILTEEQKTRLERPERHHGPPPSHR